MKRLYAAAAVAAIALVASDARADEPSAAPSKVQRDLRRPGFWIDVGVTVAAGATWIGLEASKTSLVPSSCRWCDTHLNAVDRSVRDALRWHGAENRADMISNAMIAGMLASGLGLTALAAVDAHRSENVLEDELLVTEALTVTMVINEVTKYAVGRQRPFVRFENPDVLCIGWSCARPPIPDDQVSFFSGHTAMAFSLATASGTVSSMRRYPMAPFVWVEGLTAATVMGYLRIAADRHYFTDVITGAAVGATLGAALPALHLACADDRARPRSATLRPLVLPATNGVALGVAGTW